MKKRILVIMLKSRYNVLSEAALQIVRGMEKRGYSVDFFKGDDDGYISLNSDFYENLKNYDFLFSLQALAFENAEILAKIKIPYISWIFDPPMYLFGRVRGCSAEGTRLFVIDRTHVSVIQRLVKGAKQVHFLPHGGFPQTHEVSKKDIGVFVPFTMGTRPEIEKIIREPMPVQYMISEKALEILRENSYLSVEKAVEMVLDSMNVKLDDNLFIELLTTFYYIDQMIRYEGKCKLVGALLEAGIPIHMAGETGGNFKEYSDLITFHGSLDIQDTVELMGRSKVIINIAPTYTEGLHERILTAMLAKAICFTTANDYVISEFDGMIEPVYYNNLEDYVNRVKFALDAWDTEYQNAAEENYQIAMANHTWEKRGETIIDWFEKNLGGNNA